MIYILAQFSIRDLARYRRYQSQFPESFAGSGGVVLAADERVKVIEGEWPLSKIVLLQFPDEASYRKWYLSPAYQAIVQDRVGATSGSVVVVHGIASSAATDTREV